MKIIILATLVVLVFGDHHEGHQSKGISTLQDGGTKQAIKYGVPFNAEVIFNPLAKDSKSERKENKVITITSSSHSQTFKNKTSHSSINHGSKPDGSIFYDLPIPHKNVVSFISHHSTFSQFSNSTKGTVNSKNKEKSFVSESTQRNSNHISHLDDGSYKPDSYGHVSDALGFTDRPNSQTSLDHKIIKSTQLHNVFTTDDHSRDKSSSNFDDGSYKPELYKRLDDMSHNSYDLASGSPFLNYGLYKHGDHQLIKSAQHTAEAHSNDRSHFDDGSYKPELHKSLDYHFNDGSYKYEGIRAHQIMKSAQHHDKYYDDGTYKPEFYKTIGASVADDGSYKEERLDKLGLNIYTNVASNYDDGSYKPELYKSLVDTSHNSYGLTSHAQIFNDGSYKHGDDHQIIKSTKHTEQASFNDGSHFDDGSYKPELHKSLDLKSYNTHGHASGVLVFNDGSYKHEATRAHQIMKSAQQHDKQTSYVHSSDASNYDDGLYKPELYKSLDDALHNSYGFVSGEQIFNDGSFKHEADQQIIKSTQHFDKHTSQIHSNDRSNFDDGSYKPELYKTAGISVANDEVYKQETSHAHQIMKSAQHHDKRTSYVHSNDASNYDDGSYKPELYKSLDHPSQNSYGHLSSSSLVNDGSYKKDEFYDGSYKTNHNSYDLVSEALKLNDGSYKYKADKIDSHDGSNCDDGTYKPELFKTLKGSISDDGSYKYETSHERKSNVEKNGASNYDDGSYKPELYKSLDYAPDNSHAHSSSGETINDGSYKHEASHYEQHGSSSGTSNSDDGSYKPEISQSQKIIQSNQNYDHTTHNLHGHSTSSQSHLNDGSHQDEYSSSALLNKLSFKPHNEYGIPDDYKN